MEILKLWLIANVLALAASTAIASTPHTLHRGQWLSDALERNNALRRQASNRYNLAEAFHSSARDMHYRARREFLPPVHAGDATLGLLYRGEALVGRSMPVLPLQERFRANDVLRPGTLFTVLEDKLGAGPTVLRPTAPTTILWLPLFHSRVESSARNPFQLERWYAEIRDENKARRELFENTRMRVYQMDIPHRLHLLLSSMAQLYGQGNSFVSPMTQDDFGDLLWATREVISRAFTTLKKSGQLQTSKTKYEAANMQSVHAIRYRIKPYPLDRDWSGY